MNNASSNKNISNNNSLGVAEASTQYAIANHHWQSDGLSSYPPRDPLVGQSQFFNDFESSIVVLAC